MSVRIIVVMGVSGSGKSTVAAVLALHLGCEFLEGDDLHPPANRDKLHRGIALTDADREPWLQALEQWIDARRDAGASGVLTCSALKHSYRRRFAAARPELCFLYLRASEAVIAERLAHRRNHFMSPALLHSQMETMEDPDDDEPVAIIDVDHSTPEQAVNQSLAALNLSTCEFERPSVTPTNPTPV